ncbi:hypothetical protein TRIUR3_24792 [Triticum urartu]|uniref:Uncharacterized protein n=1 Tax=Triticum urartu TaxID=4572 RepID=M8A2D9_TRIUA|nr:hypothetical protein TRIUR3_24792 [Triticum urartu]
MKGDDIGTPPPSGLENRTKGFPRCSKEDRSKGHGNAFKKETASADVATTSTGKPSKDFVPALTESPQMPSDQESKTRKPCSWLEPPRQGEMHPSPDKKVIGNGRIMQKDHVPPCSYTTTPALCHAIKVQASIQMPRNLPKP